MYAMMAKCEELVKAMAKVPQLQALLYPLPTVVSLLLLSETSNLTIGALTASLSYPNTCELIASSTLGSHLC